MSQQSINNTISTSKRLGSIIADARKRAGITGAELAEQVGISQSKISKIEQGYPPLLPYSFATRILNDLDATQLHRHEVELLYIQNQPKDVSDQFHRFQYLKGEYWRTEKDTSDIRVFTHNMLPALLQTVAYRRAFMKRLGMDEIDLRYALKETLRRQDQLWLEDKRFLFIFAETALYTTISSISDQLVQLDRVERMIDSANVRIGIIPTTAGLTTLCANFALYDQQIAYVEAGVNDVEIKSPEGVAQFIKVMNELDSKAYYDSDARTLVRRAVDYFRGHIMDTHA